jgi:UDP-N-acetylglucosamine 3-dehydrogenase
MLNVSIIGCGNMGRNHLRVYSEIPEVKITSVVDIGEKKIELPYDGIKIFNDYKEMIEKERPNLVSICVPTSFHYEVAKYCLENKINVLLEKPICLSEKEAEVLFEITKFYNVKFLVGHIERFNPALLRVKEMIKGGELGQIIALMSRRVGGFPPQIKDANVAVDLAIHDIDIANFLLDDYPQEISVKKKRSLIEEREDSVEFFLKYINSSAYIQANWITPVKIRKLCITGTEGYLELDYINQEVEFYKSNYQKFKEITKDFSDYIVKFSEPDKTIISLAKKEPLKEEILYFINCVKNDVKIDSTFALDALKIALT